MTFGHKSLQGSLLLSILELQRVKLDFQILLLLLAFLICDEVHSQNCSNQITCGSCIRQVGCAWCFREIFPDSMRCHPEGSSTSCPDMYIANPQSFLEVIPFADTEDNETAHPIDVSEVRLNLRLGEPQTFKISVTPQRNLPLDFYILIDLSFSMNEALSTVQAISARITDRVGEITNNVRLGLGGFNEKLTLPFSQDVLVLPPEFDASDRFAFRHIANLTDDIDEFVSRIIDLGVTGNYDRPENGLEALAQVITCEDIIGWRPRTNLVGTRLVLFMTDIGYHYAGEGRLGGISTPYDGSCLLEETSEGFVEFTRYEDFDYPSVGQILELLRDFDVTTVFAIREDTSVLETYETLASTILNVNSVRAVTQGFSLDAVEAAEEQILAITENEYRRLLQTVTLDTSAISTALSIEVIASCPPTSSATQDGTACENVPLDATVNFTVVATLNTCEGMRDGEIIQNIISSPSFGVFNLMFSTLCDCQCTEEELPNPSDCSGVGMKRCGVCECDEGRCGVDCQLMENSTFLDCPRGGIDNLRCSGRGSCDCICLCDEPSDPLMEVFGPACECDNFRCPRTGGSDVVEVCSGPDRGMCCNGRCTCLNSPRGNPYRGEGLVNNCQCEPVEEVCIDPQSNTLCNGRGTCGCNSCVCNNTFLYRGTFCDIVNDGSCEFDDDRLCIAMCKAAYEDEADLPDICFESCTRNRPLLFVNQEDVDNAVSENDLMTFLEITANSRLDSELVFLRGPCITSSSQEEYYLLNNNSHFVVMAQRKRSDINPDAFAFFPDEVVSINGSSPTLNCADATERGPTVRCEAITSSVLFDGIIPTLNFTFENSSRDLLVLQPSASSSSSSILIEWIGGITLSSVEVVIFNCPDWQISVQSISFSDSRDSGIVPTLSLANITSCETFVTVCMPLTRTLIAEVRFFSDGGCSEDESPTNAPGGVPHYVVYVIISAVVLICGVIAIIASLYCMKKRLRSNKLEKGLGHKVFYSKGDPLSTYSKADPVSTYVPSSAIPLKEINPSPHSPTIAKMHPEFISRMSEMNLLIPGHQIQLQDTVGQGEFGVVYRGYLTGWQGTERKLVAVKTLKSIFSKNDIDGLIKESEKMIKFRNLHVLSLIGVSTDLGEAPCIIMPYMANGSLLKYLRKQRANFTIAEDVDVDIVEDTTRKLLSICLQIAKGMCYLAEQRFVHRDLAARNCMISEDFVIKVADFGLSEDIYCCDYFRQGQRNEEKGLKLPVKWMALESFLDSIFTEKTDVWSFGVTCWEVFSLGHTPYPGISPYSLVNFLREGKRLEKPKNAACTDSVYEFMTQCWTESPDERPAFQNLTLLLDSLLGEVAGYIEFSDYCNL